MQVYIDYLAWIRSMQQLTEDFIIVGRAQSSTRQCLREYIFFSSQLTLCFYPETERKCTLK